MKSACWVEFKWFPLGLLRHHGLRGEQHEGGQGGDQDAHSRNITEVGGGWLLASIFGQIRWFGSDGWIFGSLGSPYNEM